MEGDSIKMAANRLPEAWRPILGVKTSFFNLEQCHKYLVCLSFHQLDGPLVSGTSAYL